MRSSTRMLDELIGYMAAAQEDDGYIYTAWTARDQIDDPKPTSSAAIPSDNKWLDGKDSHELYNLGHMYEAAVAHLASHRRRRLPRRRQEERRPARRNLWPRQNGNARRAIRKSSSAW